MCVCARVHVRACVRGGRGLCVGVQGFSLINMDPFKPCACVSMYVCLCVST